MHLDAPSPSTASTYKANGKDGGKRKGTGVVGETTDSEESHEAEMRIKAMQEAIL